MRNTRRPHDLIALKARMLSSITSISSTTARLVEGAIRSRGFNEAARLWLMARVLRRVKPSPGLP